MSKAEELATAWDTYADGNGYQCTAEETAIELRRLESEYNAALENWQHMQKAYEAEKVERRRLEVREAALVAGMKQLAEDKAELLEALKWMNRPLCACFAGCEACENEKQIDIDALIAKHGGTT